MITSTFRVVACGEPESYTNSNGTMSQKRQLRLQELAGWNGNDNQAVRVSNCIVGTMFGNLAQCIFYPNELVIASIRFAAHCSQGQWYQDITIADIEKIK